MHSGLNTRRPVLTSQASGGIFSKSHVRWLDKSRRQPRLSPSSSGLEPQWTEFPKAASWCVTAYGKNCSFGVDQEENFAETSQAASNCVVAS
ncbi:hypothetical protein TNCV_2593071 [Trichonephila clavipes]|nr:hypothetical protein TNCV_2593071 [Trichonephila clavipes]